MMREISEIDIIQNQKQKDIEANGTKELDEEGRVMAEYKRDTLDIIETPVDPLR